jgi:NAD(P)-dependent dehydrogenase (short-subunit alcohol dehydrogenase family)
MGAAYVCALAREGAIVAGTDIIDDLGASLAEQLQSEGRDVSYYHHDVTSRAGWEAVVASVQQAHGPIDVLVNNAGVQVRSMGIEAGYKCLAPSRCVWGCLEPLSLGLSLAPPCSRR